MKILIDEDLPVDLRLYIPGHDVFTVRYQGWNGLKNGTLIRTAEENGFEVLVTGDQSLNDQQNPKKRKIAVVALTVQELPDLLLNVEELVLAIGRASIGSVEVVVCRRAKPAR